MHKIEKMIHFATIELNTNCNQSCVWCYNMSKLDDSHQISEKTFDNILNGLVAIGCNQLLLTGGEPTLHPLMPHFINKAIGAGINRVYIVSNGYRIHKDFFDVLKDHRSNVIVNISIHGSNKEIHDKLTQMPGSFDALLSNIGIYHKHGFAVNAQTTICQSNHDDLMKILSVLEKNSINNILFNYSMRPIGAKVTCNEFISVNEFFKCLYETVSNYTGGIQIEVAPYMPLCIIPTNIQELFNKNRININYGCGFNTKELIFDPQGNILLCLHLPDMTMGNINSIDNLSMFIQEMRTKVNSYRRYPMNRCKDCNEINYCFGGGCPVLWLTNKFE